MQGNLPPEAQEKLETLQELQETAQNVAQQKQSTESALNEAKTALNALEDVDKDAVMYREIGELFIQTDYDTAAEDLEDKVDSLEIRVEQLNKQEDRVRGRFDDLQEELQQLLQGGMGGPSGPAGPGGAGGA